ncbi:MAG: amidohydrolase [Deltaproteobacteria bacterium]|uniref:5-methylthioadenosine/S-adenosylhomocysteine deaminase n=1 Tax=Candidatus Zymogenus saltonus TaxID=2844893 RepID=A0A9D8PQT9_9DELT|nr:amidohydrolase [Candidatus Zymogenus saltonus]
MTKDSESKVKSADVLIKNGAVITMRGSGEGKKGGEIIERGAVTITGDSISFVGGGDDAKSVEAKTVIDASGCVVMPGLINGHTHAAMSLFRGIADDLPLETWLNDFIFPAESQNLDAEFVYWGTKLAIAEMLLSGTTTFCDMYLFEDSVARATKEMKMRGVLGEVLYDFPSPNYGELSQGYEYTENFIKKWKDDPLITPTVQPHALDTCAPELLVRAGEISKKHDVLCIIHVAESQANVAHVRQKYNKTSFKHLDDLGVLSERFVADHAVWVTDEEMDIMAEKGVKVITNPESNMKLASGWAPVHKYLKRGIVVGLGTDGCASNNDLDLFGEMDTLAKLHKIYDADPTHMDAHTAVRLATVGSAKALGLSGTVGTLEKGKRADIIVVDFNRPHLTPVYDPFSHLVYAAMASDVRDVLVNGEILVKDGSLTQADTGEIIAKARELSERVKKSIKGAG